MREDVDHELTYGYLKATMDVSRSPYGPASKPVRRLKMKFAPISAALFSGGMLVCASAFAQTSPTPASPSTGTVMKQPTDGGDSPSNPRATDAAAAAWHKQHIDGGDSPSNPNATDASAAAWHKQHIDGGDSPSNPRATDASAAAWHKQHIDGGDSPSNPRATDASAAAW